MQKRLSHGLLITGSYTWSHTLDEQSGLGLFFTGNDPLNPHSAYASSDFDRTHVLTISYQYEFPKLAHAEGATAKIANGWGIGGLIIAQSGQPYSIYDFTGGVASVYYGTNNFIGNPIVPLLPGQTPSSAQKNPPPCTVLPCGPQVLNPAAFGVPLITGGQMGVPVGDNLETSYGTTGRNIFRAKFQSRFDFSVFKETKLTERFALRFDGQIFNIFNHPVFDAPNNNVAFNPSFCNPPVPTTTFQCSVPPSQFGYLIPPSGHGGTIQHTIGSPRFAQLALHLRF